MFRGNMFEVFYSKESEELQRAIDFLSQTHRRLKVSYEDRRTFLGAFMPLLIDKNKAWGLQGVSELAKVLHLTVDFMDADGSANTLNCKCIREEIRKVYAELYPKDREQE